MFPIFHFLKTKPLVGLDINTDEVCLSQLKKTADSMMMEKFAVNKLPVGAIVDGRIKEFSVVKLAIQQLVKSTQSKNFSAAIAVPANSVISKRIKLASILQQNECEIEICTRLNHYLPGTTEEIYFDFIILGMHADEYHDVLLVAARHEQVNAYVDVVNQAGLVVKIVDVDSYSLMRAVNFFIPQELKNQIIAVLDVGQTRARFVIYQRHQMIFNQQFSFHHHAQLAELLKRGLQLCFSNYQEMIIYYFITGAPVEDFLQAELSVQMRRLDPFSALHCAGEKCDSSLLTSVGLVLRGGKHDRN